MLYRENGQFKTSYRADQQIFPIAQDRALIALLLAFAALGVPQKDDVRHVDQRRAGALGAVDFFRPRNCDFSISASYWWARRCD